MNGIEAMSDVQDRRASWLIKRGPSRSACV